jgi:hypothetical protein
LTLARGKRFPEQLVVDVVQERGELLVLPFSGSGPRPFERL